MEKKSTAITMWIDGELYVCESTVDSNYWPTNGIQKTPCKHFSTLIFSTHFLASGDKWLRQAMEANYNVVWLPLSDETAAKFNVQKAIEFFRKTEGLPYGFHNMIFCWLDTVNQNFPPPLSAELLTVTLPIALDLLKLDETTDIARQALNFRLNNGTQNW